MIKRFAGRVLVVAMACLAGHSLAADPSAAPAADVQLAADHPTTYTVQKGDTLWGISEKFLKNPWQWPSVWHINEQVANPHLIYPGDVLRIVWKDGQPMLVRDGDSITTDNAVGYVDGDTVRLRPRIRDTELAASIPAIPLRAIEAFLNDSRVVSLEEIKKAPYVIGGQDKRVIMGNGDTIYARSTTPKWTETYSEYDIYRQGEAYLDPATKEILGYEAKKLGSSRVMDTTGQISSQRITVASEDVRLNDRLMLSEQRRVQAMFYPTAAPENLNAQIIRIFGSIGYAGRYDVLVINKGLRDKVDTGSTFAVLQRGEKVLDRAVGDNVQLPPVRVGLAIVFRSFEKVSYALVMRTSSAIRVGDILDAPRIGID